MRCIENTEL